MRQREVDLAELRDAMRELEAARPLFDQAVDPDDIDRAIALMTAAEARIRRLCRIRDQQRVA